MMLKKLADLKRRLSVALSLGIVVAGLIVFSSNQVVSVILMLLVALLASVGVWEYARLAREKEIQPQVPGMMVLAILEVFAFYTSLVLVDFPELPLLVIAVGAVFFFMKHFKNTTDALPNIAVQFFGVCYVAAPLSLLLGVLYPPIHQGIPQEGRWWLAYLILVTKITDVCAYFIGRLWGKTPLAPQLSPKKTVEGALAGLVSAVLLSVALQVLGTRFAGSSFDLTLLEAIILGVLIGIFGQIGDLAESLLKRDAVVKDSNTLPGVGGVLDMVDSLLVTTPIVYFFLRMH